MLSRSWFSFGPFGLQVGHRCIVVFPKKSPVEGSLGFLVLGLWWLCRKAKQNKKWGHLVSPPRTQSEPHGSPTNKGPLPNTPLGCLAFGCHWPPD